MRRLSSLLALFIAGLMVLPGSALAESPAVADCSAHSALTEHFTVGELQTALATMPASVKEYTGCYQTIQDQLYAELSHGKTGSKVSSASGGSSLSAPVLIVLVLILAGGGGFAFMAWRRNGAGDGEGS